MTWNATLKKWGPSPGGGYRNITRTSKVSKNQPKRSTCVLFEAIAIQPRPKGIMNKLMEGVNAKDVTKLSTGYGNSTIAWHITNGRILTTKIGRFTMLSLTSKGRKYAKERGIL